MHAACLVLSMAAMAAAKPSDDPAARAQAALRQVAQMSAEAQHAWLQRLETRLDWANRLTLKPEEAERERARVAGLLRQKTVPWQTLVDLVRQLDQREKAAVARLVRQYRAQVYESFAKQQPALVQRQEAWYRVWSLWEAAGGPIDQQDRLMAWLEKAIQVSTSGSIAALPPDPRFGPAGETPQQVAEKQATPTRPEETAKPAVPPAKPATVDLSPVRVRIHDPDVAVRRSDGREGIVLPRPAPLRIIISSRSVPPLEMPERTLSSRSDGTRPDERAAVAMRRRPGSLLPGVEAITGATLALSDGPSVAATDAHTQVPLGKWDLQHPLPSELPRPQTEEAASAEAAVHEKPSPLLETPRQVEAEPLIASRSLPRHAPGADLAAILPKTVPSVARIEPLPPTSPVSLAPPQEPAKLPSDSGKEPETGQVTVNVPELAARITGNNLALRTLEAELETRRDWDVDQLDSVLNRLDILVLRQKDLTLFRDLLTPEEQSRTERLQPPKLAISQMAARIADLRRRLMAAEADAADQQATVLKHLDELSDRLAGLAIEK